MRCNWHRWLWGLIPLIALGLLAVMVERDRIEQDLAKRAAQALGETGSPWASVALNGRDVSLAGRAAQDEQPSMAEAALRKVWGVRNVENRAILPRKVEPFWWSARRRGNGIRLTGFVPDRTTRQTVQGLTKAALPGLDVNDRTNIARGVPPVDTWLAGLSFALKQLSLMRRGDVRFEGLALSISGEAEDPLAFKSLNTALKSGLPKGIQLANAQITAPAVSPFTWSAQLAGGQLVLAGYVAGGDSARGSLIAAAKAAFPGGNVVDRMDQAEGAPAGWSNAAVALIRELVPVENGMIEMKDAAITVSAVAVDQAQAQTLRAALRAAVPSNFKLVDQIRIREAVKPAEAKPPEAKPPETKPPETKSNEAVPAQPLPQRSEAPAPAPQVPAPAVVAPPALGPPSDVAPKQASESVDKASSVAVAPPMPTPPETPPKQAAPQPSIPQPLPPAEAPPAAPPTSKAASDQPPAKPEPTVKTAAVPPAPAAPPSALVAPNTCEEKRQRIAVLGHILFAYDSATLEPSTLETLDRLADAAKACPGMRIAIEGHTDTEGSVEYNQRLSVRRAQAAVVYLLKAGADRGQLEAVGYGVTRPAVPNDTPENMARNRRIEFSVRQQ